MKQEHTPTPWNTGACITNIEHWPEGWNAPVRIADCHLKNGEPESSDERVANAALIVRAVNSHDDLVKACERLLIEITTDGGRIGICSKYGEASWRESIEITRAALAKARG